MEICDVGTLPPEDLDICFFVFKSTEKSAAVATLLHNCCSSRFPCMFLEPLSARPVTYCPLCGSQVSPVGQMKGRDQQGIVTGLRIAPMSTCIQITAYVLFIVVWP